MAGTYPIDRPYTTPTLGGGSGVLTLLDDAAEGGITSGIFWLPFYATPIS